MTQRFFNRLVRGPDKIAAVLSVALGLGLFALAQIRAQEKPAEPAAAAATPPAADPAKPRVTVKLVTDFESGKLVSDLEQIQEITTTVFDAAGSREQLLGERCVLWVRNAHVDGKFFFEHSTRANTSAAAAQLEIEREQLAPGEHVIQPGDHKFTISAEGKLASDDPSIRIDGNTLLLKMHKVTHASCRRRAARAGGISAGGRPSLGLLSMDAALRIDPAKLPDPAVTFDPQSPPAAGSRFRR